MHFRHVPTTSRTALCNAVTRFSCALALFAGIAQAGEITCQPLDLPPISAFESGGTSSFFSVFTAQTASIGGGDPDYFDFMFWSAGNSAIGDFNLGAAPDDDNATCERCLSLCMDVDQGSFECGKWFFQSAGTLRVNVAPVGGVLDVGVEGLRIVESTVNPDTQESMPVPGGQCFHVSFGNLLFEDGFEDG